MRYKIIGDNLQVVIIELNEGETVYAEAGALNHMSQNIEMDTKVVGGIKSGFKRIFMKESFFMTEFKTIGGKGIVAFNGNVPGKIIPVQITPGKEYIVQKDSFLAAEKTVNMDIAFVKKFGAALFGGEGFILEKLSGSGLVFLHVCGDIIEYNLKPGEILKVDTGQIVGFESNVEYDITMVKGVKSMLFGGEGLFFAYLKGPGKTILQSMNIANLAAALRPYLPKQTSGKGFKIGFNF